MKFIHTSLQCALNGVEAVLTADDFQWVLEIEVGRELRHGVAEGAPFQSIFLHLFIRDVVFNDFAICSVLALIFRVEWDVNRAKLNDFLGWQMAFAVTGSVFGIEHDEKSRGFDWFASHGEVSNDFVYV